MYVRTKREDWEPRTVEEQLEEPYAEVDFCAEVDLGGHVSTPEHRALRHALPVRSFRESLEDLQRTTAGWCTDPGWAVAYYAWLRRGGRRG